MLGYWNQRSAKLVRGNGPVELQGKPYRAYSITRGKNIIVGSMRRNCEGWFVTVPGYIFYTTPGAGGVGHGIKETTVKSFKTSAEARAAIKQIFTELDDVLKSSNEGN